MVNRTLSTLPGLVAVVAALLSACGGGDDEARSAPLSSPTAARLAAPLSAQAMPPLPPLDVDRLLDWAERSFPQLFPGHRGNLELGAFTYRHYPESGNYVGVAGDDVFALGAFTNWVITRVGSREDFRCRVTPTDCLGERYPRAGWVAPLSTLAHGVSGTVTIVDERTVRITGFHYDGGGPAVYAYLGSANTNAAFTAGRIIGPRLNRPGQPYVNATIELQLAEGQTLDEYSALSIWCADFRVNFGSGSFVPPPTTAP